MCSRLLSVSLLLIAALAFVPALHAEPSGYAGRTSTTSAGCGSCHGNNASASTTVSLQAGYPTTVKPGSTTMFTVIVAHASQRVAGVSVAVRTTATGSTAAGTLAVISGQTTRLRQGEVTQSSPKTMSGGRATFNFNWTAPTQEGTYYIQAIGNACNGNGNEDSGDSWAFMQPIAITVSNVTSVDDEGAVASMVRLSPNPALSGSAILLQDVPADAHQLRIVSMNGTVVYERPLTGEASNQSELPELPSGTYAVLISTRQGLVSTPLVVVR